MIGEGCTAADCYYFPAFLYKLLQLGNGLLHSDASQSGVELYGYFLLLRQSAVSHLCSSYRGDTTADEQDGIILRIQVSPINFIREHHLKVKMILLHDPTHPS